MSPTQANNELPKIKPMKEKQHMKIRYVIADMIGALSLFAILFVLLWVTP